MKLNILSALFILWPMTAYCSSVQETKREDLETSWSSKQKISFRAPELDYAALKDIFLKAPQTQYIIIKDYETSLPVQWTLKWHSSFVTPKDLKEPDSHSTGIVVLVDDSSLNPRYHNEQFASYRVAFQDKESANLTYLFYNVFYLQQPTVLGSKVSCVQLKP